MGKKKRVSYMADFETTTVPEDCRVWGWGLANIDRAESPWDVEIGQDMDSFIDRISEEPSICFFHNLKFDGQFLLSWLLRNGYVHTDNIPGKGQFTSLINHMGAFYSITVTWLTGYRTEFRDSHKKLPMPVSRIAKAFKQPELKGSIDYHAPRPVGHELTQEERAYLAADVMIVARALKTQFAAGMTKLTVGSDSLAEFKRITGPSIFDKIFPVLPQTMDAEIRQAYRGGFTYADPRFKGKVTGPGIVYDVNSLYPSVMYDRLVPYDEPIFFPAAPSPTDEYPLYIVSITFTAKLKPDHIPCIQVRGSSHFLNTEYQTEIKDPVTLMCTNVDLALWEDHYDMDILSYNGGWKFQGIKGLFTEYIDKWMKVKSESTGGLREIAKLHLNSLYGKFGTSCNITGKIPVLEDDIVKMVTGPEDSKDPIYTAAACFITAYARDVTIRAAQEHYPVFAYADTDSLHLLLDEDPDTLDVDANKLGAWKREYKFSRATFVRPKAYIEQLEDGSHVTHIAGLQDHVSAVLTIEDLQQGREFSKLVPQRVPGGVVLRDVGFTLNLD